MTNFNYQIKEGSVREKRAIGRQEIVDGKTVVTISYQVIIVDEQKGFMKPQNVETTLLEGLAGEGRASKIQEIVQTDFVSKY